MKDAAVSKFRSDLEHIEKKCGQSFLGFYLKK